MTLRHDTMTALRESPFLNRNHTLSPSLHFNCMTHEEDEFSDMDLDSDSDSDRTQPSTPSNNLRFYSSRQAAGLRRSVGTLNLSLENASRKLAPLTTSRDMLVRVREEDNEGILLPSGAATCQGDGDKELYRGGNLWRPFPPRYNKNLKRTASKCEMKRPLISDRSQSRDNDSVKDQNPRDMAYSPLGSKKKMRKFLEPCQLFKDVKPDQSAFQQKGLMSKMQSNLLPQKLIIPDTPVKKSPHSSIMESPMDCSVYGSSSVPHDTQPFKHFPLFKPGTPPIDSSPTYQHRAQRLDSKNEIHAQRMKRRSKVIKNTDLSNMLQQFTDDLFGSGDEEPVFNSSPLRTPRKRSPQVDRLRPPVTTTRQQGKRRLVGTSHASLGVRVRNPDEHLGTNFSNVTLLGRGQFSTVYQVTFPETLAKYAVKSMAPKKHYPRSRIIQEIQLLSEISQETSDAEGREYVVQFISSWEYQGTYYAMTELCENGNLDQFLQEQLVARSKRLEDWRIWKIIVEVCLGLRFIHETCSIVHLDLKPANIMITFEGNLKLGDFGMATKLPLTDKAFENEGDREYIAPEIISDGIYDFRADIFSLGLMIVEIAANVVLPDNGNAWHKLRSGDLSDAGRLSSTEIYSNSIFSSTDINSTNMTDVSRPCSYNAGSGRVKHIPAWVPRFLIDNDSLEKMVIWMIEPDYRKRPTASRLLQAEECQYVELTRKAGAIIQEDEFGPKPEFFT
ncbi:AaceriAEL149Cp [[Ashbya] aceris (nom. inval.)]|nr:AaceriAEL149Cp [[Ashbya] aceris (nom. inval.)]